MPSNYTSGVYQLESVSMTNFDGSETIKLHQMIDNMVIEESIFSPCVRGHIDISDGVGLAVEFPIMGQETIELTYTTQDKAASSASSDAAPFEKVKRSFRVYNITNKVETGYQVVKYRLHFVSEEFFKNETKKIAKSYKNKTISTIVTDIYESFLKKDKLLTIDNTVNIHRLIIPYLNPFQAISWLSSFSVDKNDNCAFFFFEDQKGFNFKSLATMYTQKPICKYGRVNKLTTNEDVNKEKDSGYDSITYRQLFDSIGSLNAGLLGSTVYTLDIGTRGFKSITYDYNKEFTNQIHTVDVATANPLFDKTAINQSTEACKKFLVTQTYLSASSYVKEKSEANKIFSKKREDIIQDRNTALLQLNQIGITVEVPGDSRVTAGCVVDLQVPSYALVGSGAKEIDQYYAGNYLVTKVIHSFSGPIHKTIMELHRDCVSSPRINTKTKARTG